MGIGLTIRGDSIYCPLSFSLDSYNNCLNDCWHCYMRRLNYVWGKDLRPINTEELEKKLINGLKNNSPKSPLSFAIKQKKTIRFGNKTDPFQDSERQYKTSEKVLQILKKLNWEFVIQTMCTEVMMDYLDTICQCDVIVQPIISCGVESDWEILERKRTTPIEDRFKHLKELNKNNVKTAVNGEPFIPGYHTIKQFEDILKRLKSNNIKNYNVYNFHFNDFVAKRLLNIGIDIMTIWENNQDDKWLPVQQKLIDLAKKHNIVLGCPDFINSGDYFQTTNTCCGIDVKNPTKFNMHFWKKILQKEPNKANNDISKDTWDGIGDYDLGLKILNGNSKKFYTMKDISKTKRGFLF